MDDHDRIEAELERLHLDPQWRGRYWYIRCPFHDDANKSAQCFEDGWIHCHAGCPRQHINRIAAGTVRYEENSSSKSDSVRKLGDFTDLWLDLDPIDEDVKGVPKDILVKLGWKKFPGDFGIPEGIFIPYFDTSRKKVLFYQIRHPEGSERRFTFARGCSPICYGMECLPQMEKYLVFTEGSRDSVILRWCHVPAVAIPSASSGAMLKRMEEYAKEHHLTLVCAADRDEAGNKLISNLTRPFIDARPPVGKDIGEFFEQKGIDEVRKYYGKYKKN